MGGANGSREARPMINSAISIISPCAPQDDGFRKGSTHPTARRANQQKPVQPLLQKYFCFSEMQTKLYDLPSRPTRGAVRDRHGRGAGCGGRGCADNERRGGGRRRRVVLTPRRWRQVLEKQASWGRRWQESPVAGESAQETVKTIAWGMLGVTGVT